MLFWALSPAVRAQPRLAGSIVLEGEKLYPDQKNSRLWYYMPPAYQLLQDAEGRPYFTLLQMRYTGTSGTGDAGKSRYSNLVQFRVGVDTGYQRRVVRLRTALRLQYPGAELRMMPVRKFSSLLVFAGQDSTHTVKNGVAEPTDESADVNNSYWNERIVSFRLVDFDAQLVRGALENSQVILSFSYAYFSVFADSTGGEIQVGGTNPGLTRDVKRELQEAVNKDSAQLLTMIRADAIAVKVDTRRWPQALQQVDINERLPARFPVLTVYCYDFNNELRPDLYAKKLELTAVSVNGKSIQAVCTFRQALPDQYARSLQFPYAVRFDRPFRYRVIEITQDGETLAGEWIERKDWNELIDITSPPEKVVIKQKKEEDL